MEVHNWLGIRLWVFIINSSAFYKPPHQHFFVFFKISLDVGTFPGCSDGKELACNAGDLGSIPGLGRSPGEGNGNPLQLSCLENPMKTDVIKQLYTNKKQFKQKQRKSDIYQSPNDNFWAKYIFISNIPFFVGQIEFMSMSMTSA